MNAFDGYGKLKEDAFDGGARKLLRQALALAQDSEGAGTRSARCKPGHLLLAGLDTSFEDSEERARMLRAALKSPARPANLSERIRAYVGDLDVAPAEFDLARHFFDAHALRALDGADVIRGEQGRILWEAKPEERIGVDALWASALANRSEDENRCLADLIDFSRAIDLFVRLLSGRTGPERKFYLQKGELDPECFTSAAFEAISAARERAAEMGYDRVQGAHLFLALLGVPDGPATQLIRLQCDVGVSPATVSEHLAQLLSRGAGRNPVEITLDKERLAKSLQDALSQAQAQAELNGATAITQALLLWALLEREDGGPIERSLAEALPSLNRARLIRDLEELTRKPEDAEDTGPFLLSGAAGRSQDLSYLARTDPLAASVGQDALVELVLRGLHKRTRNNVLITGEPGVGKTQLVIEVSRRVAAGEAPFLRRKKIVLVDCAETSAENSRNQLEKLLGEVKGRKDVIICLDHLENLLRYAGQRESANTHILRAALAAGNLQIIGILEDRYYAEFLGGDHRMLEQFSRVEVPGADVEITCQILSEVWQQRLEQTYEVTITEDAIEKAARAADEFIMSERLPEKAIKVLREACERVNYEVECKDAPNAQVQEAEVVQAIAGMTGIAASTIAGTGEKDYFGRELARSVVGQEAAVETVVNRLKRIKAGAIRPGQPAAVFLFAGPTGTGKTELAKAVARLYSASHKLVRYDMTGFELEHSRQRLFGVPPGYVGYEMGGQLINDLNADAHSVILFDEAEKAHQSIWQGMLTLFDEAWIVDQRNVKAYGNRAIFILTSNAGKDLIRDRFRPDMSPGELKKLKEQVQDALVKYENPQTHNRPFTPEFLGRLTDVAFFSPLSLSSFTDIVRLQIEALIGEWKVGRKKTLVVDGKVRAKIAEESFQANQGREGGQGGRAVQANISQYVELAAINLMEEHQEEYKRAAGIRVYLSNNQAVAEFVGGDEEAA